MPVSTRSKGEGGKRGEKKGGDSVSKSKKPKTREDGFTVAERCTTRLGRQSKARRDARDDRKLNPEEQVLRVPLIRDGVLQCLNPWKRSELQTVLRLREFYGLLPDVDLKECYFERAWGFRKDEFVLAGWREMSVEEMEKAVREAHPIDADGWRIYPPCKVDLDALDSKEAIVRAYWELTYVPRSVYATAVAGAHVLGLVKAGKVKVGENPHVVGRYLLWACGAGLDASVIRGLAGKCGERNINDAAWAAADSGHTDVIDLLAGEFGADIDEERLNEAAEGGHDGMIDHLVERYGLDPNAVREEDGWTALHVAAANGRVRTVQHLVEKYNVDIHARSRLGKTALDYAEEYGETECASFLRSLLP
jgi:hypothetical protein